MTARTFLISILIFTSVFTNGQTIICKKYALNIVTDFDSIKANKINYFLNNEVKKIALVRLKPECYKDSVEVDTLGTLKWLDVCTYSTILNRNTILPDRIEQSKSLKKSDYRTLLELIYNPKENSGGAMCYEPRHGIMFYGDQNRFIGFIEICFHCFSSYSTTSIPYVKNFTQEEYEKLTSLFKRYEISMKEW